VNQSKNSLNVACLLGLCSSLIGPGCAHFARQVSSNGVKDELTIVEHGEGRAVIVVAAGEAHARQAGASIQKYIEKISGAKLPIVEEGGELPAAGDWVKLYVGHTEAARKKASTFRPVTIRKFTLTPSRKRDICSRRSARRFSSGAIQTDPIAEQFMAHMPSSKSLVADGTFRGNGVKSCHGVRP